MIFSNMNLLNKALLIVVLLFLKVKVGNALRWNIASSEDLLKLSYLRHLIRKFSNLASFADRVTQRGILNVGLSDHEISYCTRKITRIKRGGQKQIKFRCFKYYTIDGYEKVLVEINFPEYKNFGNVNDAYSNFIQKLMKVINKVGPVKNKRIKRNSQEWFDSEISE